MITKEIALECLEDMDDYARMANIEPIGPYNTLKEYIEQTDKKLQAFNRLLESCEECEDFDGWAAFMISADDYHEAMNIYEEDENI